MQVSAVQWAQLPVLAVLLWAGGARAVCDTCAVRVDHIKDFSTPFPAGSSMATCKYYKDAACCSPETVQNIAQGYQLYSSASEKFNWNACNEDDASVPKMSAACEEFMKAEACFYECDVSVSKYRRHKDCQFDEQKGQSGNGWELFRMPIKASYCDQWYEACKNDYFCYDAANMNSDWFSHAALHGKGQCTKASGNCKTFATVFGQGGANGGKGICEMWGNAFIYSPDDKPGYVMNFTGPNPNDKVHATVAPQDPCPDHNVTEEDRDAACGDKPAFKDVETKPCEVCHLRNEHTKDVALPETQIQGVCSKYAANSCCDGDIADAIDKSEGLYGPEYRWNKCYFYHEGLNTTLNSNDTLKAQYEACDRWFQEEECLYECDVNAGKWRKHLTCFAEDSSLNGWQIKGMPIKASECDAFYEACKNLVMCACTGPDCPEGTGPKSLFGLATSDDRFCSDSTKFCTKTVGQVWKDGKEWCEMLWDNSFVYERHEAKAYSMVWNSKVVDASTTDALSVAVHESNPNDLVFTEKGWPPPCNFTTATPEMCNANGEVVNDGPSDATGEEAGPDATVAPGASTAASILPAAATLAATLALIAVLW